VLHKHEAFIRTSDGSRGVFERWACVKETRQLLKQPLSKICTKCRMTAAQMNAGLKVLEI
jgi:hypothetical protein